MKCSPKNFSGSSGRKPTFSVKLPRVRKCVSVIQACCAFQTIGGMVHKTKIPSKQYKPGRLNSWRNRGAKAKTRSTQTISKALVNRDRNPRPMSSPVSGHQNEKRGLFSTASQKLNIAANQKKIDNASVVITNAPTLKIGVTLKAITAQRPTFSLNNRFPK